ncbi:DUF1906 domain-containing protein [Aquibacillus sp. 3ASR75-11]|uniref:DUF1906 domain-containing protein n=1 Tax=Terrihalobacillus insolitus TaxID=2950438 RepID=A0A9X3WVP3_9BACI|nr:DUF1906 domain-containing protein [Terrihalobacillus insolitus]MDC3414698.1 DUF1906 domain-containing protein [Terrihalobacillus insolitus]MDC3424189.1 DUF1906 domain-containing protein [Terrihalobacillus insolitus]
MANEGYDFLCRYYAPSGEDKLLSKSEAQDISNAGMDVVTVWEWGNTSASHFTYNNGLDDGRSAVSRALEVGQPFDTAIYFAVDYPASMEDISSIKDYFSGVQDAMNESRHYNGGGWVPGVYGSYMVVREMDNAGILYKWQTYTWSSGKVYDYNNIYQYSNGQTVCGHSVDYDSSSRGTGGFRI